MRLRRIAFACLALASCSHDEWTTASPGMACDQLAHYRELPNGHQLFTDLLAAPACGMRNGQFFTGALRCRADRVEILCSETPSAFLAGENIEWPPL